jgi:DNA invertase Pin-like site-specific DNA recombinase
VNKTAIIYLRVSSSGQVNKGFDPEGYSIPAQRDACRRYAEPIGADVVREYVEPGVSGTTTNRPALQRMLAELSELHPDYAIFYDLSRVARDDFDALWLLREIEGQGCKLESTLERIDDTSAGKLLYTVMAGVNAFRSRGDAQKVKMGMQRKHATGGTVGRARIGYLNVRKRLAGREVRTVELDPERAPLIKMAFHWYATGEYTISMITEMLDAAGLRSIMTAKRPSVPLSRSSIHAILRDDYYIGVVTFDGVKNPSGERPRLIEQETFDRVQELLEAHRVSGNRSKKARALSEWLALLRVRRQDGLQPRQRQRRHLRVLQVLQQIQPSRRLRLGAPAHRPRRDKDRAPLRHLSLANPVGMARVRQAVEHFGQVRLMAARAEAKRAAEKVEVLKRQQQQLIQLHYQGLVDEEVLAAEQACIKQERAQLAKWQKAAHLDARQISEALEEALQLIRDPGSAYGQTSGETRRLFNQALFERLVVRKDDGSVSGEPTPWLRSLEAVARLAPSEPSSRTPAPEGSLTAVIDRHQARKHQSRLAGGLG